MERKSFIAAAAGLTAAGAAAAAAAPDPAKAAPLRFDEHSDRNMVMMSRIIDTVAEDLRTDAHDYGGFRVEAINHLMAATESIEKAIHFEETHGSR